MLNAIHDKLTRAKERLRQKQKLEAMLHEAQAILKKEQMGCSRHEQVLKREKSDVEKLEGFSLTGLFYSLIAQQFSREHIEAVVEMPSGLARFCIAPAAFGGGSLSYPRQGRDFPNHKSNLMVQPLLKNRPMALPHLKPNQRLNHHHAVE